jgi:hypothetical protein
MNPNLAVVEFVAVKAPKSHKVQQGRKGAMQAAQSKAFIFRQIQ